MCLDLDKPRVGCYFGIYEMCDFGQIINLDKHQRPQLEVWEGGETT